MWIHLLWEYAVEAAKTALITSHLRRIIRSFYYNPDGTA
jgi:hypothetical protein